MILTLNQRERLWDLLLRHPEQAAEIALSLTGVAVPQPMLGALSKMANPNNYMAATYLTRARLHYLGLAALEEDEVFADKLLKDLHNKQRSWYTPIQDPDRDAAKEAAAWLTGHGEAGTARALYLKQIAERGRIGLAESMTRRTRQRHAWPLIEGTADPADWLLKPYRVFLQEAV